MKRLALIATLATALLLSACSSGALPEPSATASTAAQERQTAAPAVAQSPAPAASPTATPVCTDDCQYTAEEGSYLVQVYGALGPESDWFSTYEYLGSEGTARMWLDMGYAVCGLYEADWSTAEVVEFLEPNYTNPRLYPDAFADTLAEAAESTLCI